MQKREHYARAVIQAKKNLKVGNWDACSSIIKPLVNEYPTDSLLYLILLASLTRGYEDYLLDRDDNRRTEAAVTWDKLERLNSVNQIMQRYAESRKRARHTMLSSRVSNAAFMIAGAIIGFLISMSLSSALAFVIVFVCAVLAARRIIKRDKPFSALKELYRHADSNPFR